MSKSFQVQAPVEQVWAFMSNIEQVITCVPGAELTGALGEDRFAVIITVKVGPIKSSYKGEVAVADLDAENHRLRLVGKGQDTKGKGAPRWSSLALSPALTPVPPRYRAIQR